MPDLPSGTVTFLFTDIEGSTILWERFPQQARAALIRHDMLIEEIVEGHEGALVRPRGEGDSRFAVFARASSALSAAATIQQAFHKEPWATPWPLRVRLALHTGEADLREGDYYGSVVNRCARLRAVAHGGQTLLSQATGALVREHLPAGLELLDLGEHRLKDLVEPAYIYQLVVAGLPSSFPPLNTQQPRPTNLSAERSTIVGREKELAAIRRLLLDDNIGLLTLTGPGGTGKTRLSVEAAGTLIDHFEHGAFFVPLGLISDPSLVITAVAQTLGLREDGRKPLLETLKDYLRGKQILVVLDNFEQVTDAAPLAGELLAAAPRLKLLVTSRARLHVRGEREFPVPPLALPDPRNLPDLQSLTQYEAVRLFIDRAVAIKPDFSVTNENAPAVAEICARLDGLPLALELAAARIKMLPPQAILARLESRLKLLTGGGRDLPLRQQTLRGAIDWSYDILSDDDRTLFQRVAVFGGGFTLPAAELVVVGGAMAASGEQRREIGALQIDLLDGLQSLLDKNLLRQQEQEREPRFSMLETLREYAQERLAASGAEPAMRDRHADYFMGLARQAEPHLHGPTQLEWFSRLETEHDNLRAAFAWSIQRGDAQRALGLGLALWHFWWVRGHLSEGRKWLEDALQLPQAGAMPTLERGRALYCAAFLCRRLGDAAATYAYARESVVILRELGTAADLGWALIILAVASAMRGELRPALENAEESVRLWRRTADSWGLANAVLRYGMVLNSRRDYAAARPRLEEALSLFRSLGDRWGKAEALNMLGDVARLEGDHQRAEGRYHESLGLYRELGMKRDIPASLHNQGHVAMARGDYAGARAFFSESMRLHRELGNDQGLAESLAGAAGVAAAERQPERAARLFGAAARLREASGAAMWPAELASYERNLAAARAQLDDPTWERAWQQGQDMNMEQALDQASELAPEG